MMSYPSRDNRIKKRKLFFIIIFFLVCWFFYTDIKNVFRKSFETAVYPIWKADTYLDNNTINPFNFLVSKKTLLVNNEKLKENLVNVESKLADRNLVIKENIELKYILGRMVNPKDFILAAVLAKPDISPYDSLVVDAGSDLGIVKGKKVFASGNILIGVVDRVGKKTSVIKLYSSFKEELNVNIGFFNIGAVAYGEGGGNFKVKVPREAEVKVGDPVYSTGLNAPVIGSVEKIVSDPIYPFKAILFRSGVNLFEIKWVQILKTE